MTAGSRLALLASIRFRSVMTTGRRSWLLARVAVLCILPHTAWADQLTRGSDVTATSASLDGIYVALGPVASAVYRAGDWDGGFGGELSLWRVRERAPLAAIGLGLGALRLAEGGSGRLWGDLQVATARPLGCVVGLGVGPVVEVDQTIPPRWGAQGTLWIFAGAIPYVRLGMAQKNGLYLDFGIKVALPALRI